jgi:hypothetical protein
LRFLFSYSRSAKLSWSIEFCPVRNNADIVAEWRLIQSNPSHHQADPGRAQFSQSVPDTESAIADPVLTDKNPGIKARKQLDGLLRPMIITWAAVAI